MQADKQNRFPFAAFLRSKKTAGRLSMNKADHVSKNVVYSPQTRHLRPSNRYLTSLSLSVDDYCLLIGEIPAGAVVPLHSHFDRETFYVLSGEMNFYDGASWRVLKQGESADVLSNTRHAWRNVSGSSASLLVVTTVKMGVFLQQKSPAAGSEASGTEKDEFFKLVQEYG
jgi:mannose-6-phosphate isomerase-like protein (cupin superfamily)